MKNSKFLYVFTIIAILLGLFIAWNTATPQLINGQHSVGGCSPCYSGGVYCASKPNETCDQHPAGCKDGSNSTCTVYDLGGMQTVWECLNSTKCKKRIVAICT